MQRQGQVPQRLARSGPLSTGARISQGRPGPSRASERAGHDHVGSPSQIDDHFAGMSIAARGSRSGYSGARASSALHLEAGSTAFPEPRNETFGLLVTAEADRLCKEHGWECVESADGSETGGFQGRTWSLPDSDSERSFDDGPTIVHLREVNITDHIYADDEGALAVDFSDDWGQIGCVDDGSDEVVALRSPAPFDVDAIIGSLDLAIDRSVAALPGPARDCVEELVNDEELQKQVELRLMRNLARRLHIVGPNGTPPPSLPSTSSSRSEGERRGPPFGGLFGHIGRVARNVGDGLRDALLNIKRAFEGPEQPDVQEPQELTAEEAQALRREMFVRQVTQAAVMVLSMMLLKRFVLRFRFPVPL
ncbi:unnamed protein product [Pedinophyceae sp. YPF-701]|nr:unnamed protein product [Pedinophyceae sp. YPF-701]